LSIFSTPISKLTFPDIEELLTGNAVENVRLEFKREVPKKEEILKKISSFANTFGGYIVIGAEGDNAGKLIGLPGVLPENSYKQTVVQYCAGGLGPPVIPEVSEPIPDATNSGRVFYVIAVSESELAPHFINDRKGVYIRTDEFSARYVPELAEEREIRHLLDRRLVIRDRRKAILERAYGRFKAHRDRRPTSHDDPRQIMNPSFLMMTIVPRYPASQVVDHASLLNLVRRTRVAWRGVNFPRCYDHEFVCQHESAIALDPFGQASIFEANTWGLLNYGFCIVEERPDYKGIHSLYFIGRILISLDHAAELLRYFNLSVSVQIKVTLSGVRDVPWVIFQGFPVQHTSSPLDDVVEFSIESTTDMICDSPDAVAGEVLRTIFFALNFPSTADQPEKIARLLQAGRDFNGA